MFSRADGSFRRRPTRMSLDVAAVAVERVVEHARRAGIDEVMIALHGGEPLLVGRRWMTAFLDLLERASEPGLELRASVQTNGTLLDEDWVALFAAHRVSIGVSLDGPPEVNDRHRFDRTGRSSYAQVRRAIELLAHSVDAPHWGVLVVADADVDGAAIYRHLRELEVRHMDFLWPDFHHDEPPPWPPSHLARYFIGIFDAWYGDADASVRIRWFEAVLSMLAGGPPTIDSVGPQKFTELVVETDGELQPLDSLRICGDGFTSTGIDLRHSAVAAIHADPLYQECVTADEHIPVECAACPVQRICGGGLITHRWGRGNRFRNPSVHSDALRAVIEHIQGVVARDAPFLLAG
jgi:uncharacterized protein